MRYFFDQVNLAYKTPNAALLPPLYLERCRSCKNLQDGVLELVQNKQRLASNAVEPIAVANISKDSPGGQTWVTFELTQSTVPIIDADGKEIEGQKASSVPKIVSVVWGEGQWKVFAIANRS